MTLALCLCLVFILVAFVAGYVTAIHVATQRPLPWILRRGVSLSLLNRDLADFYENTAREEREVFACHMADIIFESNPAARLGFVSAVPRTREGYKALFKLADIRTKETFKSRRARSPVHSETA
jgi:hypothetical protein